MKKLSRIKADGTLRPRPGRVPAPSPAQQRSRISNGKHPPGMTGNSAEARRYRDLVEAYGEGLDMTDERVRALVKDAAAAGVKIEMRGDTLAHLEFVRLSGVRRRNLEKLAAMRVQASPTPPEEIEAKAGLARLQAKLASLARQRDR
jgi:hypothetical protein